MEPIRTVDDAELHRVNGKFMTGKMDIYDHWVHVHRGDYWIPRGQVDKLDADP